MRSTSSGTAAESPRKAGPFELQDAFGIRPRQSCCRENAHLRKPPVDLLQVNRRRQSRGQLLAAFEDIASVC